MPGAVRVSWRQDAEVKTSLQTLSDPKLSNPSQDEEEVLLWPRKNLGQYSSLFLSPTHLSHTTNITLSRIKCERYIFIKKCVRSFVEVVINSWLCSRVYLYMYTCSRMWLYNIILKFGAEGQFTPTWRGIEPELN